MNSVQTDSVGHIAQVPVTNASPEASGIYLGHTIVTSQPSSCTCLSSPPPTYEEATRYEEAMRYEREETTQPTQINVPVALYVLDQSQKLIRSTQQAEQERRTRGEGCFAEPCSDGCCGDFALICCYISFCLCCSFFD